MRQRVVLAEDNASVAEQLPALLSRDYDHASHLRRAARARSVLVTVQDEPTVIGHALGYVSKAAGSGCRGSGVKRKESY